MLNFSVRFKPGVPIYEHVVFVVKKAIVTGQLKEGDAFPSVREISKELKINPNTVQKAITHLVQEKLLEIRPGIGSVVAELGSATQQQKQKFLAAQLEQLIIEAKQLGITQKELSDAIKKHWKMK